MSVFMGAHGTNMDVPVKVILEHLGHKEYRNHLRPYYRRDHVQGSLGMIIARDSKTALIKFKLL